MPYLLIPKYSTKSLRIVVLTNSLCNCVEPIHACADRLDCESIPQRRHSLSDFLLQCDVLESRWKRCVEDYKPMHARCAMRTFFGTPSKIS